MGCRHSDPDVSPANWRSSAELHEVPDFSEACTEAVALRSGPVGGGTGDAVTVRLLGAQGNVVAAIATGMGRAYSFTGLAPGQYQLEFVTPASARGGHPGADSYASTATGRTALFTLASGGTITNLASSIQAPGTIIGSDDLAASDGGVLQDAEDIGFDGATARLLDTAGRVVATTVTGAGGTYSFAGVAPGKYRVELVARPPLAPEYEGVDSTGLLHGADPTISRRTALFAVPSSPTVGNLATAGQSRSGAQDLSPIRPDWYPMELVATSDTGLRFEGEDGAEALDNTDDSGPGIFTIPASRPGSNITTNV